MKQTAAELGYSDPYFFSRMFKRYIGVTPARYRLRGSQRVGLEYVE